MKKEFQQKSILEFKMKNIQKRMRLFKIKWNGEDSEFKRNNKKTALFRKKSSFSKKIQNKMLKTIFQPIWERNKLIIKRDQSTLIFEKKRTTDLNCLQVQSA